MALWLSLTGEAGYRRWPNLQLSLSFLAVEAYAHLSPAAMTSSPQRILSPQTTSPQIPIISLVVSCQHWVVAIGKQFTPCECDFVLIVLHSVLLSELLFFKQFLKSWKEFSVLRNSSRPLSSRKGGSGCSIEYVKLKDIGLGLCITNLGTV